MQIRKDERFSFYSHTLGALASMIGTIILIVIANRSSVLLMLSIVYGISITMLFSASALYHAKKRFEDENSIWRKMDHLAIFIMIAGTYTPISYIFLEGKWRWGIIIAQWSLVALGALFKFFFLRSPRYISAGIYLAMGWMAVLIMGKIFLVMTPEQIIYLVAGALSFTAGAIIYMMKRPNPLPERVGFHGVFHVFILLGGFFHYLMVLDAVNNTIALVMK